MAHLARIPREFPPMPLIGVGGLVFDATGRVLLIRRASEPMKGHWSIPGGLVELGETLDQAVIREMAEETGLIVEPVALVELFERIYRNGAESAGAETEARVRYHYVLADYLCRVTGGSLLAGSDAEAVTWAARDQWLDSNPYSLPDFAREIIEKAWQMGCCQGEIRPTAAG